MTIQRTVNHVWTVHPNRQSPGHAVGLVLEPGKFTQHDPFLLLAEDWFSPGTFDVHPHRGIETVTYVISGKLGHYDNKFGEGELLPGNVQWMTAGRGVIHKEDPAPGETVHSLQLWVNLPRAHKMTQPRYQNLSAKDMPIRQVDGGFIRVFSGNSGDTHSNTLNYVPVTMVEINLEPGAKAAQDLPADYNGFLYILEGEGKLGSDGTEAKAGQGVWLGEVEASDGGLDRLPADRLTADRLAEVGSEISIQATTALKALLYAGRPLHEPVVSYGPFVMNTREEIAQAFEDYQSGKFAE